MLDTTTPDGLVLCMSSGWQAVSTATRFVRRMAEEGIPARPYFAPIHLQKYMTDLFGYKPGDYPVTERLGAQGVAIPFSSVMTEEQV